MPSASDRLKKLPPYVFAVISQRLRELQQQGVQIIRLDIGSPDLPPADFVVDALYQSARGENNHGYSGYSGTPEFREAIARYYDKRFSVSLNPETEVLPLIGSKEGIVNLSLAYLDRGDIALVPAIGYPAYGMGTLLAGAEICYVDMPASNGFLVDVDSIDPEVAKAAKLLWINYPNNPTGVVADLDYYRRVVEFCDKYDILLASDNPYCDITFDDYVAPSVLQVDGAKDVAVEFMSMSKSHNMAGWRLGAAVGSAKALKLLLQIKSNVDSGHFRSIYDAGIVAIDQTTDDWMVERNHVYARRRDIIMQAINDIGLSAENPKGTLYIWAKVLDMPAEVYVEQALTHAHVSLAPGEAYGPGGTGYIRISLSIDDDLITEAVRRLRDWYKNR